MKLKIAKAKNGQYHVCIIASNGEHLFESETYKTKQSALHAAQLIVDEPWSQDSIVDDTK